jgi:hypothetical protein
MEYGRTTHFMRNIVGRVTYGLVGLDKLMQNEQNESRKYLDSFLSLINEQSNQNTHRLLPEVEEAINDYNPKLKDELENAVFRVREISRGRNATSEIVEASAELEKILNSMYETMKTLPRQYR